MTRSRQDLSLRSLAREETQDDPVVRRYNAVYDAAPAECRWTEPLVKARLLEAQTVFRTASGRIGPKQYGTAMPDPLKDAMDIWWERGAAEEVRTADAAEHNRTRFVPTLEQCSRADGALYWQRRYLIGTSADWGAASYRDGVDRVEDGPLYWLNAYLACKIGRVRWGAFIKGEGAARSTVNRHVKHACLTIAMGLIADGIPTGEDETLDLPSDNRVVLPEWWGQVEMAMAIGSTAEEQLRLADGEIEKFVRREEFAGRSLKGIAYAEFRGRVVFLQRVLREREGLPVEDAA